MIFFHDFHFDLAPAILAPVKVIFLVIAFLFGLGPFFTSLVLTFTLLLLSITFTGLDLLVVLYSVGFSENPDLVCEGTNMILHVYIHS